MDKEESAPQYKTIKRLQKTYLVRCNESLGNIIPGNGIKPVSLIRRIEREIETKRKELGHLTEQELMSQMDNSNQKKVKSVQELSARRTELTERIRALEKQLLEYELL
eukprot:gnl/TRDRNA2_/TRDRNA2_70373_c0_seq1.p2 gnl/TRDRNA2_/TRDRNA2_70373_c0~~gnl/TRDRNA2_/TRDRNA2_70373_c0_seq1.p2  ORF type:complete len:108 (+),score=41.18 gnl/TRDRNA2_/TRDRNA2_70373_c0_seq1:138-461(+)